MYISISVEGEKTTRLSWQKETNENSHCERTVVAAQFYLLNDSTPYCLDFHKTDLLFVGSRQNCTSHGSAPQRKKKNPKDCLSVCLIHKWISRIYLMFLCIFSLFLSQSKSASDSPQKLPKHHMDIGRNFPPHPVKWSVRKLLNLVSKFCSTTGDSNWRHLGQA